MNKTDSLHPTLPMPAVVRLPRSGQLEPWSGFNRGQLDRVTRPQKANEFNPPVKSYVLPAKIGAQRGVRLIDLESLLAYVHALPAAWPGKQQKTRRGKTTRQEAGSK